MSAVKLISRLPAYYRNNPNFLRIAEYLEKSSMRISGLFIQQGKDYHLMLKDGSIYILEDWEAYNLLRVSSEMLVTSGENLRKEIGIYGIREVYGDPKIQELNDLMLGKKKQKLFNISRKMTFEETKAFVNQDYYDLLDLPQHSNIYDTFETIKNANNFPVLFEVGLNLLHDYFKEVAKGRPSHIDTFMISNYTGEIDPKYIGPKFELPL